MVLATLAVAVMTVGTSNVASARICKRVCMDGVCWSDCSKLPGQTNVKATLNKPTIYKSTINNQSQVRVAPMSTMNAAKVGGLSGRRH
jgi:hypothetical protein